MVNKKIAIIIPAYNEEQVIRKVVEAVTAKFSNVICVDDASKDDTSLELMKTSATIIKHPVNMGAGGATQTGVEFALLDKTIQYFVTFDGDGQHKVKDIQPMVDYLVQNKLDIVFGSRFLGEVQNISNVKSKFLKMAKVFNGLTSHIELTDPHIGLRVFNRKFAERLDITLSGFAHASELTEFVKDGGYSYGEFPVTVQYTDYSKRKGQPMINAINIVSDLLFHKVSK